MTNSQRIDDTWQTLNLSELVTVTGGAGSSSASTPDVSASLATIQTSIKDLASTKQSAGGLDTTTALCLGMMMSRQNQSSNTTVIAGGGAPVSSSWSFRSRGCF